MNTQNLTKHLGGALLGLLAAFAIGLAMGVRAQAQSSESIYINKDARNSESITAQRSREAELNTHFNRLYQYRSLPFTYGMRPDGGVEAKLKVTNHGSNEIKFISWQVLFTDPTSGQLVGKRELTSKSRIAPGKEKTLKKTVSIPRLLRVTAKDGKTRMVLPKMTSTLTNVTYADGTTSTTP
ncbi:MAG: hypothetical protein QOE77_1898 [Blastocatellia bacterium]|nr:hypothetical protein [Blastocatellia bacterium]